MIEEIDVKLEDYEFVDLISVHKQKRKTVMFDIEIEDNQTFHIDYDILTHNSSISKFVEVRDPEFQAGMPLRGKVLNVYGMPPIDAMENNEVADIVTAINLEFNEQLGDWIVSKDAKFYDVIYESMFEMDKDGMPLVKSVICSSEDRFLLNKRWVTVEDISKDPKQYRGYIKHIEINVEAGLSAASTPDYFHFRRLWDYRGFRKNGVKYEIVINGKDKFICNDNDEIFVDNEWKKVSLLMKKEDKKMKDTLSITKVSQDSDLTMYHKKLQPDFDTKLKYAETYIATDADPDGGSINNLLVNLFHEYFPELFWNREKAFVKRIVFPMICAEKGKKVLYFSNRLEFDSAKDKKQVDETWSIHYYKGLGSMKPRDWEYIFSNLDEYSVKIVDDGHLDELMQIFFDSDANVRKLWLAE